MREFIFSEQVRFGTGGAHASAKLDTPWCKGSINDFQTTKLAKIITMRSTGKRKSIWGQNMQNTSKNREKSENEKVVSEIQTAHAHVAHHGSRWTWRPGNLQELFFIFNRHVTLDTKLKKRRCFSWKYHDMFCQTHSSWIEFEERKIVEVFRKSLLTPSPLPPSIVPGSPCGNKYA